MSVEIKKVIKDSIAWEIGLEPKDQILTMNGNEIHDILDYDFYQKSEIIQLEVLPKGMKETFLIEIEKDEIEDLGAEFETYLIDKQHSCTNDCVFCFVNQMPEGMRESLYFKDDDERLSFLFGNYITMTNMKQKEVDRIIKMHISPIHVSVHATNEAVRVKMLKNRFAGESLDYLKQFAQAGIDLHCQIVLCRGYNDKEVLKNTMDDLYQLGQSLQSVAIVPVGLTKFRENLPEILPHNKETAKEAIACIEKMQQKALEERGRRIFYPSDEFFLLAQTPLPNGDYYEEYAQLENGVGLLTLLQEEFLQALDEYPSDRLNKVRTIDLVTGEAAFSTICLLANKAQEKFSNLQVHVHKIKNNFFGGNVTVAGLITAKDLTQQLLGKTQGSELFIPSVMLNYGKDKLLDDVSLVSLEETFGCKITPVKNEGQALLDALLGRIENE